MIRLDPLFEQGLRVDGRKAHELRKVTCRIGIYEQADGSAYVEQGNTKVLAAVYGPHEVLQADGGNFVACINAATMALIDAGIPMRDYVCACTASLIRDIPIVDANHLEETMDGPVLIVAVLPKSEQIVLLQLTSRCHLDYLDRMLTVAMRGCQDLYHILDQTVRQHACQLISHLN